MKKTKLFFGIAIATIMILTSCEEGKEIDKITTITKITYNGEDTLVDKGSRHKGDAHSGEYSYRTDSIMPYAGTVRYDLNDSLINSNLRVILNFWAKSDNPVKGDAMCVSLQDNEKCFLWANLDPIVYGAKPNVWINVIDSVNVSADMVTRTGLYFKFFATNTSHKSFLEVDDVSITIEKIEKVVE